MPRKKSHPLTFTKKSKYAQSVFPGVVSSLREVPKNIPRPYYVPGASQLPRSPIPAQEKINRMKTAGICAREVMLEAQKAIGVGVTTDEIDAAVHKATVERGAYPSPLQYHNFPKSVCTSVNEIICHGIPDSRKLQDGDIVNLDVTVFLNGVHGDHNYTFEVGKVDQVSKDLIRVTNEALWLGISKVHPGGHTREIGKVIEQYGKDNGYGVVEDYTGHGIGEEFHTTPTILHYDSEQCDVIMTPGMTFTIEPMFCIGKWQSVIWKDNWTVQAKDFSRSAQFEHTLLVTESGVEVLTLLPDEERLFPLN
ncbi:MAG: type I methionyl aminopeptidase [Acidimicrobiia bacterium]|nr:type I methionyl aminopeptidase [Acidimicrobiia bacterium]